MCLLLLNGICFYLYTSVLAFEAKPTHFSSCRRSAYYWMRKRGKEWENMEGNTDSNKILYDYFFFALSYKATIDYFPGCLI